MAGNSFGQLFRVTTFGESHGPALGCIVDGCPPGLDLSPDDIQQDLDRRRPGQSKHTSQRRESDHAEILSGVFDGVTTGAPIGIVIRNEDQRTRDYERIREQFRPGHADYTYLRKYGIRDYRGSGRASARETVCRVAAGAIARKYLNLNSAIQITGYLQQMGDIVAEQHSFDEISRNPFFFPDGDKIEKLEKLIQTLRKAGDSIGARVNVEATNVPAGLGEPVFDKLDAEVAKAMMSINAVKGVELGAGFDSVIQHGSEHRDEMHPEGFLSNNAGGILGGISSGQNVVVSIALKPTSSIQIPGRSVDIHGEPVEVVTTGRHDPCVGIRAVPIAEAMLALVLMDHLLRYRSLGTEPKGPCIPASTDRSKLD